MKRIPLKVRSVLSFSIMLMLLTALAFAQNKPEQKTQPMASAPAQQWVSVNVFHIKPDMVAEYEELVKSESIPAEKKGGVKWRATWQTARFGEGFMYVAATPIENFAQYDSPSPYVKALGEDGARAYLAKVRRFITSQQIIAALERPDLSYPGKLTGPPKMAVVNFVQIAPGRNAEYENLIKTDVLPAMKKAEVLAYLVSQTVLGGNANEYVGVTVLDKFADLDKGNPLLRALGQDGFNKFLQKTAGIIVHQERIVARYRADLSFMPEQMAEKK